jgi:hypothetical protein
MTYEMQPSKQIGFTGCLSWQNWCECSTVCNQYFMILNEVGNLNSRTICDRTFFYRQSVLNYHFVRIHTVCPEIGETTLKDFDQNFHFLGFCPASLKTNF